ncbi:hypothetical protein B0T25DRAFT_317317 [Lasiosphaeria hispida]|uniref:Uncharacterized protein n=1 Tax=Lasiosphaeria hispida TaxID=260671 RepID=A0AAJ0M9J7_9PEZI|nr:hypothetical protein B0T25DRAFT_317317 [Lasiosphaeria hispida]
MYGSYGSSSSSYSSSYNSYSSYSTISSPMDIAPTPFSSRGPDASCAFPSWPRRSSLSESDASEERATSYLSDEDLFPTDVFEDDARSVSSHGSSSPMQSPTQMTEADLLEMQRERALYQREMMRVLMSEKERRRQQTKRQRRSTSSTGGSTSASAKKGPKSKLSAMTPIAEAE